MKSGFVPIGIQAFVTKYLKSNPGENRKKITKALEDTLQDYKAGAICQCGNPIWVVGSAVSGKACFTCITGESVPDNDYEIDEACK